jgi:predicted nucleic acid-binding protein
MSLSSFLTDSETVIVADASVIINLNATGQAPGIIRAIPNPFLVTDNAFAELAGGLRNGHSDAEKLQALIEHGLVRCVSLGDNGTPIYESLIEGSALRTLDDGEAATIGYAYEAGGVAMIDERKALKLCAESFPELAVACTAELLVHEAIEHALGRQKQIEAVFAALRDARMRVPPAQISKIVSLIGDERATKCNSLPKAARVAS